MGREMFALLAVYALTALLYVFAGHQTWRLVNIVGAREDAIQAHYRNSGTPWVLYLPFVMLWPVFLAGSHLYNGVVALMVWWQGRGNR